MIKKSMQATYRSVLKNDCRPEGFLLREVFSGFLNPDLTEHGVAEAKVASRKLKELGFSFNIAFTSKLQRAQRPLALLCGTLASGLPGW